MTALRDPALPGLPAALDVDAVREELQRAIDGTPHAYRLERLSVLDVQYRPGESCVVSYALKLRPEEGGRSHSAHLAGWLHGPAARSPALTPEHAAWTRPVDGDDGSCSLPPLELPALSMTALPFPLDPALPGLARVFDPGDMRALLGRRWTERGMRVRRVLAGRLGHVPGARAAVTLEVLGESRVSGEPEVRRLVGKMDASRAAAAVFARSWAIWRAAALRVPIAPPVGFIQEINLSLQERVPGVRLSERAGEGAFVADVRRTAGIVAALHDLSLPLASKRDPSKDVRSVARWGTLLASIRPHARARVEAHATRLSAALGEHGAVTGPVHGDLHPSNVLVDDGRVTLIDLDNMARGDRMADVGRFLSSLRTTALRVHGEPNALRDVGEAFLASYLARTGGDERRARLYEAAALMISAGSGFRLQREGWERTADALLGESERALDLATRGPVVAPGAPAALPRGEVGWARDGRLVLSAISDTLRERLGIDATACAVTRSRDDTRGARLRYRITGFRGDDRVRVAATGVLRRSASVRGAVRRLGALREALAFRPEALSVAAPLGSVPDVGLIVLEAPRGERFVPDDGGLPQLEHVESVGAALRALHETPVDLGRQSGVSRRSGALCALVRRCTGLEGDDAQRAGALFAALRNAPAPALPMTAVLGGVAPRQLVLASGRWTHTGATDVALGDPRGDVADLAAGIARLGLAAGRGSVPGLRQKLRRAYAGQNLELLRALPRIEATALLRAALLEARGGRPESARALLDAADERHAAIERLERATVLA